MFSRWPGWNYRRRRALAKSPAGPLRDFLNVPFPLPGTDCRSVEYMAIDLETTGLRPSTDEVLSIGLVGISGDAINLASARHWFVSPRHGISADSVAIHMITDDDAAGALPLERVLPDVLALLAGRVLVAHHAALDVAFIDHACRQLYGAGFVIPVIDTLAIAIRRQRSRGLVMKSGSLRLSALRQSYNLPEYHAHHALNDALACAELFMAMQAEMTANGTVVLRQLLRR